jgi:hypothetical protein
MPEDAPTNFWSKLGTVTAFLVAVGGILTAVHQCSEPTSTSPYSSPAASTPNLPASNYSKPQTGQHCCDASGQRCELFFPAAFGSVCFCRGLWGEGYTCP